MKADGLYFAVSSFNKIVMKYQPLAKNAAADFPRYADKELSECQRSRCFMA